MTLMAQDVPVMLLFAADESPVTVTWQLQSLGLQLYPGVAWLDLFCLVAGAVR